MGTLKISREPVWLEDVHIPEFPSLSQNLKCDVCVVGAGIAGISTAYMLAQEGKKIVLIDDGTTTAQVPGFRGYPTTLFLTPSGQVLYKVTGMQSEAQLAAILNHLLPTP